MLLNGLTYSKGPPQSNGLSKMKVLRKIKSRCIISGVKLCAINGICGKLRLIFHFHLLRCYIRAGVCSS